MHILPRTMTNRLSSSQQYLKLLLLKLVLKEELNVELVEVLDVELVEPSLGGRLLGALDGLSTRLLKDPSFTRILCVAFRSTCF